MTTAFDLQLENHLAPADMRTALEQDVRTGLTAEAKWLPSKWFYDERGSELFEQITRLPEYYPTRRERAILSAHAHEIAALTGAQTLIELGSGTSDKTRTLLNALQQAGTLTRFVPFDVDLSVLAKAGETIAADYPDLSVHAVVGDFERHLPLLPIGGRRLIAFLGSTIGNLLPSQRARFLSELASTMEPGDALLLGTDLVKDERRLVRAYDDHAGVTAAFNLNILQVLARELGADVDLNGFAHVAVWDATNEWIEMRLRSLRPQVLRVLDLEICFAQGEHLRTEISTKFRQERVRTELNDAGLRLEGWWTDVWGDFGLSLAVLPATL